MKFNKLITTFIIMLLLNSNIIYSYERIKHFRKFQKELLKKDDNEFIDNLTCQKLKEQPEEDKSLNIEMFIVSLISTWNFPYLSEMMNLLKSEKRIDDPKCPSKASFLKSFKYISLCKSEFDKYISEEEIKKVKEINIVHLTPEQSESLKNLQPREACIQTSLFLNDNIRDLSYTSIEFYDKASDYAMKKYIKGVDKFSNIENFFDSQNGSYFRIIYEFALKYGTPEELKDDVFVNKNNVPQKVYDDLVKEYHLLTEKKSEIKSGLPICSVIEKDSKNVDSNSKNIILRRVSALFQTIEFWSKKGCSYFNKFLKKFSGMVVRNFKEDMHEQVLEKILHIVASLTGGFILKAVFAVFFIAKFFIYIFKAIKAQVNKLIDLASENWGYAVGSLLNVVFKILHLNKRKK